MFTMFEYSRHYFNVHLLLLLDLNVYLIEIEIKLLLSDFSNFPMKLPFILNCDWVLNIVAVFNVI